MADARGTIQQDRVAAGQDVEALDASLQRRGDSFVEDALARSGEDSKFVLFLTDRLGLARIPGTADLLYSASIFIYFFCMVLYNSLLYYIIRFPMWPILGICLVLLCVSEYFDTGFRLAYNTPAVIAAVVAIAVFAISALVSHALTLFLTLVFVLVGRNRDYKLIAWTVVGAILLSIFVVMVSMWLGIIEDYIFVQRGGKRVRHSFGFQYASWIVNLLWVCLLAYFYVTKSNFSKPFAAAVLVLDIFLYLTTDSRFPCLLIAALTISSFFIRGWINTSAPVQAPSWTWPAFIAAITIFSLAAMIGYNNKIDFFVFLNRVTGDRVAIAHRSYVEYGVHPFGQETDFVGSYLSKDEAVVSKEGKAVTFIDNSYCGILVKHGPFVLLYVVGAYAFAIQDAAKRGDRRTLLLLMLYSIHSLGFYHLSNLLTNLSLLLIGTQWLSHAIPARTALPFGESRSDRD